jgi:urease accessory protein
MDQHKSRVGRLLPILLVLFAMPAAAHAHTSIQGAGDVLNGMLHPLTTPAHVLLLLALGLLAGQQSPLNLKTPMVTFLPVSAFALLLTTTHVITGVYPPVLIAIALCAGILVALEARLPRLALIALFAAAAVAIGLDSAVETGSTAAVLKRLFGTWISLGLIVFNLAYYVSLWAKQKWQKIGVRVVGSWLIAITFLVLAFSLKR